MHSRASTKRTLISTLLAASLVTPVGSDACTSLLYKDAGGAAYAGRTMELPTELPYKVAFYPQGSEFASKADQYAILDYTAKHAFLSITVPDPLTEELKVVQGLNDQGLSFSLLAYAGTDGPKDMVDKTLKVLTAIDLGSWALSQFKTVGEVKAALQEQPVLVTALLPLDLLKTPFHYTLHDANGDSIVIEFANGEQQVYDNPLGVMTNGPEFSWHLTNLNNYTYLSNIDHSELTLSGVHLEQPDSGIATVGLPASNTSVGRFVRAVYYSQFAEKARTPDEAVMTLANVMNNFDRPRGITVDNRFTDEIQDMADPGVTGHPFYTSEYTTWTAVSDLSRLQLSVRLYTSLNYVTFDLSSLLDEKEKMVMALSELAGSTQDGTQALRSAD